MEREGHGRRTNLKKNPSVDITLAQGPKEFPGWTGSPNLRYFLLVTTTGQYTDWPYRVCAVTCCSSTWVQALAADRLAQAPVFLARTPDQKLVAELFSLHCYDCYIYSLVCLAINPGQPIDWPCRVCVMTRFLSPWLQACAVDRLAQAPVFLARTPDQKLAADLFSLLCCDTYTYSFVRIATNPGQRIEFVL